MKDTIINIHESNSSGPCLSALKDVCGNIWESWRQVHRWPPLISVTICPKGCKSSITGFMNHLVGLFHELVELLAGQRCPHQGCHLAKALVVANMQLIFTRWTSPVIIKKNEQSPNSIWHIPSLRPICWLRQDLLTLSHTSENLCWQNHFAFFYTVL